MMAMMISQRVESSNKRQRQFIRNLRKFNLIGKRFVLPVSSYEALLFLPQVFYSSVKESSERKLSAELTPDIGRVAIAPHFSHSTVTLP